ncbi:MAG: carboxypeptidase-like regulatory domain-containing protein [Dehalococcoidia bacterium]
MRWIPTVVAALVALLAFPLWASDGHEAGSSSPNRVFLPGATRQLQPGETSIQTFDFEGGAGPWQLDAGVWALGPVSAGQALIGAGRGFARLGGLDRPVSRLEFRFSLEEETSGIHASILETLTGGHRRYFASITLNGVALFRQEAGVFTRLGEEPVQLLPNQVATAVVLVGGGSIDVLLDGKPVLGADDATPPPPGSVSFESLGGKVIVDDVRVTVGAEAGPHVRAPRSPENLPAGPDVGPFVGGKYRGDIVLTGSQALTLTTGGYTIEAGNIKLSGNARLRIEKGAGLIFDRDTSPLIHWGIDLREDAVLELPGGSIVPAQGSLVRISAFGRSKIEISDARPLIHFINAGDDARVSIQRSRFFTTIGGSIQLNGRVQVDVRDSQVGAIALIVRAGTSLAASGLAPGHVSDFDLQRDLQTAGIGYGLRLKNVDLVADTLGEGPFERGWVLFADDTAVVDLNNSTFRKVVFEFPASGPLVSVKGLRLDQPTTLVVGTVKLSAVTVTGQWGFFLHKDRQGLFEDCKALWFFVFDTANVLLKDSTMNEFDPRNYTGTFSFQDGKWTTAGEIIGNNDFVMAGTYEIDAEAKRTLSWSNSKVTRRFPVMVKDQSGVPIAGIVVTAARGGQQVAATTDGGGTALLPLPFSDADFRSPWSVSVASGQPVNVDFFTDSPLAISQ